MKRPALLLRSIVVLCLILIASVGGSAVEDFTFIQATDIHTPMPQSRQVLGLLAGQGEVDLAAYGLKVPAPSFAIATGDLTEFGGGNGWWEEYLDYWKPSGLKVYHALGNHDNTWHSLLKQLRSIGQGPYYSFDAHGCHFICLMSATIQDPRPSFGEEQLVWLREDLKRVSPATPVFVFFHHPIGGAEFCSPYDWHRVLDELRPFNVVLVMTGHSHSTVARVSAGVDEVIGGTTFGPNAGLTYVSVRDGVLRVAYRRAGQPAPLEARLEKPIPDRPGYPGIVLDVRTETFPGEDGAQEERIVVESTLRGRDDVEQASLTIDDRVAVPVALVRDGDVFRASAVQTTRELLPGEHYVRISYRAGEREYTRSAAVTVHSPRSPAGGRRLWSLYLGAASKCTPAVSAGRVFVGDNSGTLRCVDAATGAPVWTANTGAEILTEPLVAGDRVIVGNGDGLVAAFSTKDGRRLWSFRAGAAVYSSPVLAGGAVVFGDLSGALHAIDLRTGRPLWVNRDAEYSIESKPATDGERVWFGAWDQYVRCVDARTGKLIWKELCEGSRTATAAKRYYSAADATPHLAGGKLFIADRKYVLTVYDASSGRVLSSREGVAATGVSEDGKAIYLRQVSGELVKMDTEGNVLWSVDAGLNAVPAAPVEKSGVVYVCSAGGTVSAISARYGEVLWRYQASPGLFVMSSVASDGTAAFVSTFGGRLTAVSRK